MSISSYKDLIVWQKSMQLVVLTYDYTKDFPPSELYGLTQQMRRAAISIPSNIAEGSKRGTRKDYRQFLLIALGSGAELETQIDISFLLNYGDENKCQKLISLLGEVLRMLQSLVNKLR